MHILNILLHSWNRKLWARTFWHNLLDLKLNNNGLAQLIGDVYYNSLTVHLVTVLRLKKLDYMRTLGELGHSSYHDP